MATILEILTMLALFFTGQLSLDSLMNNQPDHICTTAERDIDCLYRFEPVCALVQGEDCKSGMCYRTRSNPCVACSETSVVSYTLGACTSIKEHFCPEKSFRSVDQCPETYAPVCAFYTGGDCESNICARTIRNACTGCVNPSVLFYINGECPSEISVCQPEDRIEEENMDWLPVSKPVVAFYQGEDCESKVCSRSEISTSTGGKKICQDPNVLFYIPDTSEVGFEFQATLES